MHMRSLFSSFRLLQHAITGFFLIAVFSFSLQKPLAAPSSHTIEKEKYIQFHEWRYLPKSNPPALMWWNGKMADTVPTLYVFFTPDKITLTAVTPNWPDIGILFYIKDNTEKQGINLTLQRKDRNHCYYSATIDKTDRQNFVNNLVTSRKARLITPSSYSQSLSLKQVDQAMETLLTAHPEINLALPKSFASKRIKPS